jgi:hypothetical protein
MAFLHQPLLQKVGHPNLVLNDQQLHDRSTTKRYNISTRRVVVIGIGNAELVIPT